MEGVSGFLAIVAGSYFCAAASPPGMLASMNGILSASIFGAGLILQKLKLSNENYSNISFYMRIITGRAVGLTVGSLLIAEFGIRFAYLALGVLAGVTSIAYLFSYHLWLKKIENLRLNSTNQGTFCWCLSVNIK